MLLYSSLLGTKYTLNADAFIGLVIECIEKNPREENRIPGIDWKPGVRNAKYGTPQLQLTIKEYGDDSRDAAPRRLPNQGRGGSRRPAARRQASGKPQRMSEAEYQMVRVRLRASHIIAIRQEKVRDGVHWYSDYVLNLTARMLEIELSRTYRRGANPEDDFSAPLLISLLEDGGYLSDDGHLPMSRRPLDLDAATKEQREGFSAAIRGADDIRLPIIYVPRDGDGSTAVDATHLASQVKGIAHVVIGPSTDADYGKLSRECKCELVKDSPMALYWPTDSGKAMMPDSFFIPRHMAAEDVDEQLRQSAKRCLVQQRRLEEVPEEQTWSGVTALILDHKADDAQHSYEKVASANQTLQNKIRTIMERQADAASQKANADADHDAQMQQLKRQLDETQSQLHEQKQQNIAKDEKLRQFNAAKRFENDVDRDAQRKQQQDMKALQDLLDEQEKSLAELQRRYQDEIDGLRRSNAQYQEQVAQLKRENNELADRTFSGGRETLLTYGTEHDLFPGEVQDYVLEAVDEALRELPSDKRSRRSDVYSDVLEANRYRKLHEQRRAQVKNIAPLFIHPGAELFRELEKLGYERVRVNNHYVLEYGGDSRYHFTTAKTPSDKRSGENAANDLCRFTQ